MALIRHCRQEGVQQEARNAGAKGVRVIGSIESGQEILQRTESDAVYVGMTGNWITIEPLIATGAVDLFAMDMNCSPPSLEEYAKRYPTTFVSVSPLVNVPGIDTHVDYLPERVEAQAAELTMMAISNFRKRARYALPCPSAGAVCGRRLLRRVDLRGARGQPHAATGCHEGGHHQGGRWARLLHDPRQRSTGLGYDLDG